ncbi:hypothetical protein J6590_008165 [Homalodisca vitripennis]|nr:hypothetical protein J6590_008165 [Homalodisca vitripennis]
MGQGRFAIRSAKVSDAADKQFRENSGQRSNVQMGTRVIPDKSLSGVPQLLEDLQRLLDDHESSDILFLVGREEAPIYAHRIILMAR